MSRKVYKYPLDVKDVQEVMMPRGAKILHLDVQNGRPCLWALVYPSAVLERRRFYTYGTGHDIEDPLTYLILEHIGTYQLLDGTIVFHVFEHVLPLETEG